MYNRLTIGGLSLLYWWCIKVLLCIYHDDRYTYYFILEPLGAFNIEVATLLLRVEAEGTLCNYLYQRAMCDSWKNDTSDDRVLGAVS